MMFRFVGTCEVVLSVDPEEFRGMSVEFVAETIEEMLEEEYPEVDVPYDDIVLAADEVVELSTCES